jgi:hypothetical protein
MITEEEKRFLVYWESRRDAEKKMLKQWLVGLPVGLLIGVPVFINFLSGWYKKADVETNSEIMSGGFNPLVLIIAVFLIISFTAIFSKRHKWDMNEQRYLEIKGKFKNQEEQEQSANNNQL